MCQYIDSTAVYRSAMVDYFIWKIDLDTEMLVCFGLFFWNFPRSLHLGGPAELENLLDGCGELGTS